MGRYLTKTLFLVLLLHLLISASSGASVNSKENGVCIPKGGRFPPNESEGKPPKSAYLEFKDLNLCKVFHGNTCCSASQMHSASLAVQNLAAYGKADKYCLDLFELLECSICHPHVGIQSGPLGICASFCDRVFEACSDAYLSSDASNQVIVPCGASEGIICEKISKWESNGTAFCDAVGFTVQTADDLAEEPCHGSNATLEPMVPSLVEIDYFELFRDLQPVIGETTKAHMVPFLEPLLIRHFVLLQHSVQTADDSAEESLEQQVIESGSGEKTQNLAWFQDLGQQVREMKLVWVIFRQQVREINHLSCLEIFSQ